MTDFEKRNLENMVELVEQGLKDHDLFWFKHDGDYPCFVSCYVPHEGEKEDEAYIYILSTETGKSKHLTQDEILELLKWLEELNDVGAKICEVHQVYHKAKNNLVNKVAEWVR